MQSVVVKLDAQNQQYAQDESYSFVVRNSDAVFAEVQAKSYAGVVYALESLAQLIRYDDKYDRYYAPSTCTVTDAPRFPHRGLLVDSGRHFLPVTLLKKTIRALRMNKMNVLHWHLTEAESWPVNSKAFPEAAEAGAFSSLERYTIADLKDVVEYARKNAVKIVPEFDQPGHIGALYASHPEWFACAPKGSPTMNPGNSVALNPKEEGVYSFMQKFLIEEMLPIFIGSGGTDTIHIGTDEVPEECWKRNADLEDEDPHKLFLGYIQRVSKILLG